jgi:eukaryotic-like serine/threonine-protein kinase
MDSESTRDTQHPPSRTFAPDAGPGAEGAGAATPTWQCTGGLLAPGQTIGRGRDDGGYEIVRRLDRGGTARVFLARRLGTAGFVREVALKCMAEEWGVEEHSRTAFAYEAKLLGLLNHPNIVQATDLVEERGRYHVVLEYVEGASLKTILRVARRDRTKLTPAFCCHVAANVAEGLQFAHELFVDGKPVGIVHRDVTPANIMVALSGIVKLLDFGIAYSRLEGREHTQTGTIKGTYAYSSPEQASDEELDGRSDIFSLGIVFSELLTQRRAFDGGSYRETIRKIRDCAVADVRAATQDLPTGLRRICRKALARAPCDRFQSGAEFAAVLREELKEQSPWYGARECAAEVRALGAFSEHASADKPEERHSALVAKRSQSGSAIHAKGTLHRSRRPTRISFAAGVFVALAALATTLVLLRGGTAAPATPTANAQEASLAQPRREPPPSKPLALELERPTGAPQTPALVTEALVRPIVRPKKKATLAAVLNSKTRQVSERPPIVAELLPKDSRILARLASPIDPKRPGPVRAVVDEECSPGERTRACALREPHGLPFPQQRGRADHRRLRS